MMRLVLFLMRTVPISWIWLSIQSREDVDGMRLKIKVTRRFPGVKEMNPWSFYPSWATASYSARDPHVNSTWTAGTGRQIIIGADTPPEILLNMIRFPKR
ncbi:hypothetical protein HD554DRAFT_2147167 [Boletus coccyginus]|nr:hypothetical protein HD554DRAFT_2147167 [Boletus coccyginus]